MKLLTLRNNNGKMVHIALNDTIFTELDILHNIPKYWYVINSIKINDDLIQSIDDISFDIIIVNNDNNLKNIHDII